MTLKDEARWLPLRCLSGRELGKKLMLRHPLCIAVERNLNDDPSMLQKPRLWPQDRVLQEQFDEQTYEQHPVNHWSALR